MIQYIPTFRHVNNVWRVDDVISVARYSMRVLEMNTYPIPMHLCRSLYNNVVYNIQDIILLQDEWRYILEYEFKPERFTMFSQEIYQCDLTNNKDIIKNYNEKNPSNKVTLPNGDIYARYGYMLIRPQDFYPYDYIYKVIGVYSKKLGWFAYKEFSEIIEICREENDMFHHSNIYSVNNDKVYIVKSKQNGTAIEDDIYKLVVIRKIVVDDLKLEDPGLLVPTNSTTPVPRNEDLVTQTFHNYIDVPERFVKLLTLQLKREILEYISQPIPEELNASIEKIMATFRAEIENKEYSKVEKRDRIS